MALYVKDDDDDEHDDKYDCRIEKRVTVHLFEYGAVGLLDSSTQFAEEGTLHSARSEERPGCFKKREHMVPA
jgi:hypothetical protein